METMNDANPIWLVEIRLKSWVASPPGFSRTVAYEEVIASGEIPARFAGIDQFERRCKHEPVMRRKMQSWGLSVVDCCAPDAVQL